MKQNGTLLNTPLYNNLDVADEIGDDHAASSIDTPMKPDAFKMSDDEKIEIIADKFAEIMDTLGLDLSDDSLSGTPYRVAKMYVKEIFSGLNPDNKPVAKLFDNKFDYNEMLLERNISFFSNCEHHFVPFYGVAHVAYFAKGKVIGLSKLNRIVKYYAQRPQVQERLTEQIANELKTALNTSDVAVMLDAKHLCVASRGIEDINSSTITTHFSGKFRDDKYRNEFIELVNSKEHG